MDHRAREGKESVLGCLLDYLRVVPSYSFIVTVIAIAMAINWVGAKIRQWRLEGLLRRLWEKRNLEIRKRKIHGAAQGQRAHES